MQDEDPGASCWFDDFTSLLYGHAEAGALPPRIHPRAVENDDNSKEISAWEENATTESPRRKLPGEPYEAADSMS